MPLDQSQYLDYIARCEQAFRPFAPIELPDFFKGRVEDVGILRRELKAPGRHVAIYGERGVGKTSLAKLAYFFAMFNDEMSYLVRCGRGSDYETIFDQLLLEAGIEFLPESADSELTKRASAGLGPLSAGVAKTARTTQRSVSATRRVSPALLLRYFQDKEALLIIDEFDRVENAGTHTRLAETLKHFSDAGSQTKIIVVGVAETLSELIGEHQSLTRCLAQIKLERMSADELGEIVATGEERAGVVFQEAVRKKIIGLSDGFPFYTHLLCKYSAQVAGEVLRDNPSARVVVSETEYRKGLQQALKTGEASLSDTYQAAVITVRRKTEMFRNVLWAIAYSQDREVQVREIADNVGFLTGKKPRVEGLSNYLGPLTKPEKKDILVRVRQGYYKFANPLMRAYIRLLLEQRNIELGGQYQFPWMKPS